jgi:putative Holliday junction resolvase
MERFMAFDLGEKRIGIAVSDPFNTYALPVETYHRKNLKTDIDALLKIIKEKRITAIVCGLPVNFDGTDSIQTQRAKYFIDRLKEATDIPVYTADERCTTMQAHEVLIEEDYSREKRKKYVDTLAATFILDGFLSSLKNKQNK